MGNVFCIDTLPLTALIVVSVLSTIALYRNRNISQRWIFAISFYASVVLLGMLAIKVKEQQVRFTPSTAYSNYIIELNDKPILKSEYVSFNGQVKYIQIADRLYTVDKQFIFTLHADSNILSLQAGDRLLANTSLLSVEHTYSLDGFNYKKYLEHSGISGAAFISKGRYKILERASKELSLRQKASIFRNKVIDLYKEAGFMGNELSVLSALTVGYKKDLSEELKETYSIAGASHILALSGMHIAILGLLLMLFLKPLEVFGRKGRFISFVITIVSLCAFAFWVGLSASVVRATVMFALYSFSGLLRRKSLSVNNLCVAAFVILLFSPYSLFDVSFQLSFSAILSIILFHKPIESLLTPKYKITKYLWSIVSISIAVQILTSPIVMFYFNRFSVHFLLTNIIVIPLLTLILFISLLLIATYPFASIHHLVADCLNLVIKQMNNFLRTVELLPFSSIENIYLSPLVLASLFLFALVVSIYINRKTPRNLLYMMLSLLMVATSFLVQTIERTKQEDRIIFYNNKHCAAIHLVEKKGCSYVLFANGIDKQEKIKKKYKRYWIRAGIKEIDTEEVNSFENPYLVATNLIVFKSKKVAVIDYDIVNIKTVKSRVKVDFVYLCEGFRGKVDDIYKLFVADKIIVHSSVKKNIIKQIQSDCIKLRHSLIVLNEKGDLYFSV